MAGDLLVGALLCAVVSLPASAADAARSFPVFSSPYMNRFVHGREHSVALSDGALSLGNASIFFGVDDLSNPDSHYLSGGIQWHAGSANSRSRFSLGAMNTEARGSQFGGQTLLRAQSRFKLSQRWYVPDLSLESDQLSGSGAAGASLGGRATIVGLAGGGGDDDYKIGYFSAGQDFNAWGSSLVPGDRGLEVSGSYGLADGVRLSNTLRMHGAQIATGTAHGLVDQWSLAGIGRHGQDGRPWRLSGQIGNAGVGDDIGMPLSVSITAPSTQWRDWRVRSTLGWYRNDVATPDGLPINGGLWQVSFGRCVEIAGLQAQIEPSLAFGGSRYDGDGFGSRAGLGVALPGVLDHVALSMDYASPGWSALPGRSDMRMMLSFRQNAGAVVSPLRSVFKAMP